MFFSDAHPKAIKILTTLIEKREKNRDIETSSKLTIQDLNAYKSALEKVKVAKSQSNCKLYILDAIESIFKEEGEEESDELAMKVNSISEKIISTYNTENPDKQQYSNMGCVGYLPKNMLAFDC